MKVLIPLMLGLLAASTASAASHTTQAPPQITVVAGNDTIILSPAGITAATARGSGGVTAMGNDTIGVTP